MSLLDRLVALHARSPRAVEAIAVLLGAIGIAVAITWPLITQLGDNAPGGAVNGDDRAGYAWDVWSLKEHGFDLWGVDHQDHVSQPFGRTIPSAVYVLQLTFYGPAWILGGLMGPVPALNLTVLILSATSAAAMYLLVRRLGLGAPSAIWGMVAWSVFPNAILRTVTHYPLAALACIPLLLLAVWWWHARPGALRAVVAALAVAFCWLSNPYYGTAALLVAGIIGTAALIRLLRSEGPSAGIARAAELAGALLVLVMLPLWLLLESSKDVVETTLGRDREELSVFGARLTDYLLPDDRHRLYDGITQSVPALAAPGGERVNFLGYLTLALAIVGLVWGVRRLANTSGLLRSAVLTGPIIALALVWFSLATPTVWLGVTIPTPSGLVFDALPFLRVFARFGVVVAAVVICFAAVGLASVLRGRRPAVQTGIVAAACLITLAELPPGGGVPVESAPPIAVAGQNPEEVPTWSWLRDETDADDLIYGFPAYESERAERFHMYGQVIHGRPIVNGDATRTGIGTDVTAADRDPREPESARRLATLEVQYVTVLPSVYRLIGKDPPTADRPPPGYALVRAFDDGSAVWRVTAEPSPAIAIFHRQTFWPPRRRPDQREWRWLRENATMTIVSRRAGEHRVRFGLIDARPGSNRALEIVGPGGRHRVEPQSEGDVELTIALEEGRNDLALRLVGRRPAALSAEDQRPVSLFVSDWTITGS